MSRRRRRGTSLARPSISVSTVKQGHIIPAAYQRPFATDGKVLVHVPGKSSCVRLKVEDAGTRSKAYRRVRPDGTEIDDVEASLSSLERHAGPVLRELAAGDPITDRVRFPECRVRLRRSPRRHRVAMIRGEFANASGPVRQREATSAASRTMRMHKVT